MKLIFLFILFCPIFGLLAQKPFNSENAIVKNEFIYQPEDVSFPSCHASTIEVTNEGLIAAWFGGTAEKDPDVGIWVSRYVNGIWTKPIEVANGIQHKNLRYPTWNPVLFNNGKEIMLFYKEGPNCSDWWGEVIKSTDNGKTWTESIRLPEEIWGPIKNKPVLLANGELLCPSSTELTGWQVHFEITPDFGKSWERTKSLNDGKKTAAIQPTVLVHKSGQLQALCRSNGKKILSTWSTDNGRNWTALEPISLPNPNSGIDAVTLKDGRHVLIYNHVPSSKTWGDRNILNLAISEDGINWQAAVVLENDADKDTEYSYPAVIQSSDGLIHITYTWNRKQIKHVAVDPGKLKLKPIINGEWPIE